VKRIALAVVTVSLAALVASCSAPTAGTPSNEEGAPAPILGDQLESGLVPTQVPSYTEADVQRITVAEAKDLMDQGLALLYDVRSASSYGDVHAAGAFSFPDSQAAAHLGELPADQQLIFY
jgi:flagellar basal body L-ring protein FlgH